MTAGALKRLPADQTGIAPSARIRLAVDAMLDRLLVELTAPQKQELSSGLSERKTSGTPKLTWNRRTAHGKEPCLAGFLSGDLGRERRRTSGNRNHWS